MRYQNAGNRAVKRELRTHIMESLGFERVSELKAQVDYRVLYLLLLTLLT